MQVQISAVVLAKNEEKNIQGCLKSISWCDEIIVVDDASSDNTAELAKKMGARVFSHPLNDDFASQRNYGLSKAKGEWALFVDADERVSSALWYEIMQRTVGSINEYSGFYIKRRDVVWGRELLHGEIGNIRLLRLAKRSAGLWEGKVHEEWVVEGETLTLTNYLEHSPHRNLEEFLNEINFYTDLRTKELFEKKIKVHWWSILLYPSFKFILNYILRKGFLDGIPGLIFAVTMSLHSFLVRSKLWLMWNK